MRHAIERGINWIDTAAVYGLGHSEELVGRLLQSMPREDRPFVFTKCGLIWDEQNPMADNKRSLRPESIRRECEASLRRLGVERIDLYQFHWPSDDGTPIEDSWATMQRLVEEGKVRLAGVSNFDVALLDRCEVVRHVDSLQPPFSLIRRDTGASQIPWCAAHDTGVIVYSPMQSGILTDRFSADRVAAMAPDDWRRRSPQFQEPALSRNLALVDTLGPIASRLGVTGASLALSWVLAVPGVTGAIVGGRRPSQLDDWLGADRLELDGRTLAEIDSAVQAASAGTDEAPQPPPVVPRPTGT